MRAILEPLREAGLTGVEMTCGDGSMRHIHPILACYVADYPEQCLVTCTKYGTCPKCHCSAEGLGSNTPGPPCTQWWTMGVINEVKASSSSLNEFHSKCQAQDVSGCIQHPFWEGFPFWDIHHSITLDVLHQLYQGVFKHMVKWCKDLMEPSELDACLHTLPPAYGVHHFKNGIAAMSQISGKERKDMAHVLLACLIGKVPCAIILTFQALLDFIYIAQYPSHDDTTLGYLQDSLDLYHKHKNVLINLGIHDHLNIPKFHSLHHYIEAIKQFGATITITLKNLSTCI